VPSEVDVSVSPVNPGSLASRAYIWVLASSIICYLILAFSIAKVKTPWVDEGWIASAPANWATTGSFGTPSLEPSGSWLNAELTGIQEYTYWTLPVGIVAQALWYKTFGFDVLKMRTLGILCGLLTILSWFAVVAKLSESRLAGSITAALLSIDYTFLWSAADGRMDMMCVAFGGAGLATYLLLRERCLMQALWLANTLISLSLFTHPNGILFFLGLVFLAVYFDRGRLSWRDISTLLPYLIIAALWGLYILIRPDYFLAQFGANASARGGTRWAGLTHPLRAVAQEILTRYVAHFGFLPLWGGPVPRYAICIPIAYWIASAVTCSLASIRRWANVRAVIWLAGIFLAFMTFFVGLKAQCYLVFIIPLYAAVLAIWLCRSHHGRSATAPLSTIVAIGLLVCQIGTIAFKIRTNPYASEYTPTVNFVRSRLAPGSFVFADSYFGFDLGFGRVKDDTRLGYYSGNRADLVVENLWYRWWWHKLYPVEEPQVAKYINGLLGAEYRLIFEKGQFRVYERRGM
jgi:4-amino-4-deoxy-L-arabinose transferase-like glycosyltransferase